MDLLGHLRFSVAYKEHLDNVYRLSMQSADLAGTVLWAAQGELYIQLHPRESSGIFPGKQPVRSIVTPGQA